MGARSITVGWGTTSRRVAGSIPEGIIGIFRPHCEPGADSVSNRNEYQEYFLVGGGGEGDWCVGLTALPPSCASYLEICEPQIFGTVWACPGLFRDCFTFYTHVWRCDILKF